MSASPVTGDVPPTGSARARTETDGTFVLQGVHGDSIFSVLNPPAGWALKSVTFRGADITDVPRTFPADELSSIEVTLTDRPTRLTGLVSDDSGRPTEGFAVVVYSRDRSRRGPQSRFVKTGRSDVNGQFELLGLPPGSYLAAIVPALEEGSETNPEFLAALESRAVTLALRDGEAAQLALRLAR